MISEKEINYVIEKITRRFEIELPLEYEKFDIDNDNLYISFQKSEISRTFELSEGITLEFDNNSRIIGLKVDNVTDFLPKQSNEVSNS